MISDSQAPSWRRAKRAFAALVLAMSLSGCAVHFDASQLGVPVTMASPAGQPATGEAFRVTSRATFGFFGLVSLSQPSLERALAAQLLDGQGVADLKIKVRSRWSDILISAITLGLIVPRAVTYEGVIVPR
jgi:hypothetical protein